MTELSIPRELRTPPQGPGRYRRTERIKSGWQIWDSGAGEWLTVDIIAEFTSGRVRYVCENREPSGEHVTFDTAAGGHTIWSRSTVEQKQAARLRWDQTVDGRWITWKDGKGWVLVFHRERVGQVDKTGWYLHDTLGGHMVATPREWAGRRVDHAKKRVAELIRATPSPAPAVSANPVESAR